MLGDSVSPDGLRCIFVLHDFYGLFIMGANKRFLRVIRSVWEWTQSLWRRSDTRIVALFPPDITVQYEGGYISREQQCYCSSKGHVSFLHSTLMDFKLLNALENLHTGPWGGQSSAYIFFLWILLPQRGSKCAQKITSPRARWGGKGL